MTHCDELRHSLGAYVLGALDAEEAAAVRRHLEECPDCAAQRVREHFKGGVRAGVATTPTLFVDGQRHSGRTGLAFLT